MKAIGLLLVTLLVQYSAAVMFEVKPQVKRCVAEDLRRDILVSGNFEVSDKLSRNPSFPYDHIMRSFQMEFKVGLFAIYVLAYTIAAFGEIWAHVLCSNCSYFSHLAKIEDPKGIVVYPNPDAKSGTFAFHTEEEGIYQFCFTDNYRSGIVIAHITWVVLIEAIKGHQFSKSQGAL